MRFLEKFGKAVAMIFLPLAIYCWVQYNYLPWKARGADAREHHATYIQKAKMIADGMGDPKRPGFHDSTYTGDDQKALMAALGRRETTPLEKISPRALAKFVTMKSTTPAKVDSSGMDFALSNAKPFVFSAAWLFVPWAAVASINLVRRRKKFPQPKKSETVTPMEVVVANVCLFSGYPFALIAIVSILHALKSR